MLFRKVLCGGLKGSSVPKPRNYSGPKKLFVDNSMQHRSNSKVKHIWSQCGRVFQKELWYILFRSAQSIDVNFFKYYRQDSKLKQNLSQRGNAFREKLRQPDPNLLFTPEDQNGFVNLSQYHRHLQRHSRQESNGEIDKLRAKNVKRCSSIKQSKIQQLFCYQYQTFKGPFTN